MTKSPNSKVDEHLRLRGATNFFAIGDCNDVPEAKLGFLAEVHGMVTAGNVKRLLKSGGDPSTELMRYRSLPPMSPVTTGKESGLVQMPGLVTQNRMFLAKKQKDGLVGFSLRLLGTKPDKVD